MSASAATAAPAANTSKRDALIAIEESARARWAQEKLFETDSPYTGAEQVAVPGGDFSQRAAELRKTHPKWFGTFPYPYMNGSLHLGHAFTISKIEFGAGWRRMNGDKVLWPVGFHCTGMPIKAASDKLIREMEMFGHNFERYVEPTEAVETVAVAAIQSSDPAKAKKGKLAGKSTGLTYQFQIMESIGVPREDIKKFADTAHWLTYFPPIAKEDITNFGGRVDWRRSFVTTPANPYYDSFVRWQMNKLKALNYIKFGERYTIWSPKDNGACMDHDRSSGEGVGPQEYTALKMAVTHWGAAASRVQELAGDKKVFMVAATLRPETLYGQTNCFVGPNITYGLFPSSSTKGSTEEVLYLITPRAARNMAFQGLLRLADKVDGCVGEVKGSELIGCKVHAPNAVLNEVYVLPMDSVSATKGTAVVTCVPSDSPDDYITSLDLAKKAAYYSLDPSWIPSEAIPVLSTPTYGNLTAQKLCEEMKIQSPKDSKQLAEAKEVAYKEGFYKGTMIIGPFTGMRVEDAKPKVREMMIAAGDAFAYSEPEGMVMSRSAEECVVALCDQWYLDYGQADWRAKAEKLLANMNTYNKETRNGFEQTLAWLRQWACARSYGLGSKLPFAQQFIVESLSDSTIYMAYYTIAHLLHGPPIDGSVVGPLGITAEQMTDEMWDYVFASTPFPATAVPLAAANTLKAEFSYFYPLDIRSSGKDLIPNHLTFCLYIHCALFGEEHWPRSMRANGHLMLNGEKMAKSTGNSLTLKDSLEKFGADATRVTLADAGDSIEDANFEEATANAAILRLSTLIDWCKEAVANKAQFRTGPANSFWDQIFANELNLAIEMVGEAYEKTLYKEALKSALYTLLASRDAYRDATLADGGMHADLVYRFIELQALLMTPIAPHFAEHLWSDPSLLNNPTSVQVARFPIIDATVDHGIITSAVYVRTTLKEIRDAELTYIKRKAKGKATGAYDPSQPKGVKIYVAGGFPEWQDTAVAIVLSAFDEATGKVDDKLVREGVQAKGLGKDKKVMPFIATFKKLLATSGASVAFNRTLSFPEHDTLLVALPWIKRQLSIENIEVLMVEQAVEGSKGWSETTVNAAEPGKPGVVFYNL